MSRNDKEGKAGVSVGEKYKYKDVGINEGIIRQRVRATEYVIATLAFGRLAMTKKIKAPHNDILSLVAGIWYLVKIQIQEQR